MNILSQIGTYLELDQNICWHCEREIWLCEIKHFWKPMGEGLLEGLAYGAVLGLVALLLRTLFEWALTNS